MLGYGVAFATASLSCAIGPFLAVAGVALRRGDPFAYVVYTLGMGLVVAVLAVAAALASTAVAAGVQGVLSDWLDVIGPVPLVVALVLLAATGALLSCLRRADRAGMGRWGGNR